MTSSWRGGETTFTYDAAGRLSELASPEADQSYTYGPSGRRVAAETSTEGSEGKLDYLWDPSFSLGQIAEISSRRSLQLPPLISTASSLRLTRS